MNGTLNQPGTAPNKGVMRRYWLVLILLGTGLTLTVLVSGLLWRAEMNENAIEMNARLETRTRTLHAELRRYEDLVSAVKAFVEGNTAAFNPREFDDVVSGLLRDRAGIVALSYVTRVPFDDRLAYEQSMRASGFPGFTITERSPDGRLVPAGKRGVYFPVHSTVPLRGNERALGFDTESERGELLARARDSGHMIASGLVKLVIRAHSAAEGFLLIAPVYFGMISDTTSLEDRRASLVGFALGVFGIGDVVESIIETTTVPRGFDHYIFDGTSATPEHLIYVHSSRLRKPGEHAPPYDRLRGDRLFSSLTIADRTWTIATVPLNGLSMRVPDLDEWMVLLAGLFGTAAGSLYLFGTMRRADKLQALTRQLASTADALQREVSERKMAAEEILQLARHDSLTGLPNRRMFVEALQQAIARTRRGEDFAVLYLDLDHFKDVNDTLGHPIGDLLLKSVGERVKAHLREIDAIARFGGDEFAVLMTGLRDPADAGTLADTLVSLIGTPFLIQGREIRTGVSVGVAIYGPDTPNAEALLSHADIALYRAKSEGRGTFRFFTAAMDVEVRARVRLDAEINRGLSAGEFFLLYQPQIDIETGRITAIEALPRWRHPERGILEPDSFLKAAEKNGLIVALTRFVLTEACRKAKEWLDSGIALPFIAVNVSSVCFKQPLAIRREIEGALANAGLMPQKLEIELTESALMEASREHNDIILALREKGVRLAIDDFGTGYSSLDYLRRFPADRMKIARAFVSDLVDSPGNAIIVKAAIGLARALGIGVVAVGIETEAQLGLLREWGCHDVQGFHLAAPMPAEDMTRLLRDGSVSTRRPPWDERRQNSAAATAAS